MTPDSSEPVPLRMCTSCGSLQERDGHFCEKAAVGAAGVLLFGAILYRTTTAWLEQRSGARRTSVDESNAEDSEPNDQQDCLDCGKPFAAGLPRCPACGWTYRVESPGDEKVQEK